MSQRQLALEAVVNDPQDCRPLGNTLTLLSAPLIQRVRKQPSGLPDHKSGLSVGVGDTAPDLSVPAEELQRLLADLAAMTNP